MSASIFECSDDWLARVFLAPNKPSNPSKVLYHPCLEYDSWFFHDPSVKHHLPGILGVMAFTGKRIWSVPCVSLSCASDQSKDSVSASLKVSLGSISKLLNTLLFLPFQIYHKIQAKWWSSIAGDTLQNKWSMFAKSDWVRKISGLDEMCDSAHTCTAGGHSKNTWFMDSSGSPHRAQTVSPWIPLAFNFF